MKRFSYCYPLSALQQLTRNALMHRSYEGTNAPVMVYWFDDRIEIINAGGPFGRVTPENFGKPGFADYRNPTIAETMKILGFLQRFGVGIQMAQKDLKANGNPPAEFKCDLTSVLCTVWQNSNFPAMEINAVTSQPELQPDSQPESIGKRLLILLSNGTLAKSALSAQLGQKNISGQLNKVIRQLLADELIEYTVPDKPNSRLQKYRITENGKRWLQRPEDYDDRD
jgi:predicted HTH transcriptional regulator